MNEICNKNFLFVHVPKTGGSSILDKLNQSMWKKSLFAGHDPFFILEKNNDIKNAFSFCVVRDPYTRTFSYYEHFKKQNSLECSFLDFLEIIKKKIFFHKTPMIVFPQSFYIYNCKGEIGIDKIYKYENFSEIEKDLNIKFEWINKGSYTEDDYKKAYENEKCIDLVNELFSIDFLNFNYEIKI